MANPAGLASLALEALREHPLRSFLSILGLVIGVAALVSTLALADGMEQYAREQIGTTTDLQNVTIVPKIFERVDGVTIRRESVPVLGPTDAASLQERLGGRGRAVLVQQRPISVAMDSVRTAAVLYAGDAGMWSLHSFQLRAGRLFTAADHAEPRVVVISLALADRLGGGAGVVGRSIRLGGAEARVIGVVDASSPRPPEAYGPYEAFAGDAALRPTALTVRVARAEEVPRIATEVGAWLDTRTRQGHDAFNVVTDQVRTEQIRKGMLLLKLVLGLITGISVLVGGIGVMNVLLVTVTERRREIGIRKAVGARRSDILLQFLAEAMTVSGAGSLAGLLLGLGGIFAIAPIIRARVQVPFRPAVTWGTMGVVCVIAIVVGLVFGTYPALRAARLNPIDAIRHE
jgi:putative ABC transport system permease protein